MAGQRQHLVQSQFSLTAAVSGRASFLPLPPVAGGGGGGGGGSMVVMLSVGLGGRTTTGPGQRLYLGTHHPTILQGQCGQKIFSLVKNI